MKTLTVISNKEANYIQYGTCLLFEANCKTLENLLLF